MEGVKDPRNQIAWQEFYDLYRPLIYRYACQRGLPGADAEEIVGQCFAVLSEAMAGFEYEPARGKFKSWLKTLVNQRISRWYAVRGREGTRPNSELDTCAEAAADPVWEQNWEYEILRYCVQQARMEVSEQHYRVFELSVYEGWSPGQIASALQLSPQQVYRAKHKVLQKVRAQMARHLTP